MIEDRQDQEEYDEGIDSDARTEQTYLKWEMNHGGKKRKWHNDTYETSPANKNSQDNEKYV